VTDPHVIPQPAQSLTFAVRAVARCAGVEIEHDLLNAALRSDSVALSGVRVPARAEARGSLAPPSAAGLVSGCDTRLVEAGKRFGMQIREVHPPPAARGLEDAPEFAQHFDASYRPLILRALENEQHVLAWRGWAGDRELSWGWIRTACPDGAGFRGATIWSESELDAPRDDLLVRPAVQVYVVERITTPVA